MIKLWLALPVAIFFFAADTAISQDMRLGESCNLSIAGAPDKESFLAFDRELRYALSKQDPMVMSLLVGFPLRVNDGAGSILVNDATALQARFEDVFPPKIRSAVLDHKVESVSCNFGGIDHKVESVSCNFGGIMGMGTCGSTLRSKATRLLRSICLDPKGRYRSFPSWISYATPRNTE